MKAAERRRTGEIGSNLIWSLKRMRPALEGNETHSDQIPRLWYKYVVL